MVVKTKLGKTKRRLLLDSKASGVTRCGKKNQRIMLPRVIDLVHDTLQVHALHKDAHLLEWVVLDVTGTFWALGLHPIERKFFFGKLRGKYDLYNWLLAQGSRGAELAWCRFFAPIARLTIAMLDRQGRAHGNGRGLRRRPGVHSCRCQGAEDAHQGHLRLGVA
jgi:hypothetical protein